VIVVGIDPGVRCTGYGVVAKRDGAVSLVECGVIRTDAAQPLPHRLREIFEGLTEVLSRHDANEAAIERVFQGKNSATSLLLGHARGAAMLAATLRDLPVGEYSPAQIKSAITGTGRATKEQIQYMVQQLLRLRTPPKPNDAADGVAVALCHLNNAAFRSRLASGRA
jgi:crossover junction endodeoxyribonuclease RuvC